MKTQRHNLDYIERRFGEVVFTLIGQQEPALRGKVSVVHIRLPARCEHTAVMHKKTRELLFVISGKATGRIGRRTVKLRPGTVVDIPPGTWHSFHAGRQEVEALSIFTPAMAEKNPDVFVQRMGPPPRKTRKP